MVTQLCSLMAWLMGLSGRRLEDKAIGFVKTEELDQILQREFKKRIPFYCIQVGKWESEVIEPRVISNTE